VQIGILIWVQDEAVNWDFDTDLSLKF